MEPSEVKGHFSHEELALMEKQGFYNEKPPNYKDVCESLARDGYFERDETHIMGEPPVVKYKITSKGSSKAFELRREFNALLKGEWPHR